MPAARKIKNNIQEHRQAMKITQEQLAEAVGVTRQTIISIEKENYTPSLGLAFSLSRIFKKPIDSLFWEN